MIDLRGKEIVLLLIMLPAYILQQPQEDDDEGNLPRDTMAN